MQQSDTYLMDRNDMKFLNQFVEMKNEEAFQELMKEHGPMVMGVCNRILSNPHDAEDAFQTTFLIFAKKAGRIRKASRVASWLYRVAYHVSCRLKAKIVSRQETQSINEETLPENNQENEDTAWEELRPVLDRELNRLSEKYRQPLIHCYLEGKSYDETARMMGIPHATIKIRLERARKILRDRLFKQGITISTGLIPTLLSQKTSAPVPPALAQAALEAVRNLLVKKGAMAASSVAAQVLEKIHTFFPGKVFAFGLGLCAFGFAGFLLFHLFPGTKSNPPQENVAISNLPSRPGISQIKSLNPLLDDYGDPLPSGAMARYGTVRFRHGGQSTSGVDFSPDGKFIASSAWDRTLAIWERDTGKEVLTLPAKASGSTFAFSPDGAFLLAKSHDQFGADRVLWNIQKGVMEKQYQTEVSIRSRKSRGVMEEIADSIFGKQVLPWAEPLFSPDGKTTFGIFGECSILNGTTTNYPGITAWNFPSGEVKMSLKENPPKASTRLALSRDGSKIASAAESPRFQLEGPVKPSSITLWDVKTGKEQFKLEGHRGSISHLSFSPDGNRLLSDGSAFGGDHMVRVWDLVDRKEIYSVRTSGIQFAEFLQDGTRFISAGQTSPSIREISTGIETKTFSGLISWIYAGALSKDSKFLAAVGGDNVVMIWNVETGESLLKDDECKSQIRSIDYSPDGRYLALGGDDFIRIRDVSTGKEFRRWKRSPGYLKKLKFSPDGQKLITLVGRQVEGWNFSTGERLFSYRCDSYPVNFQIGVSETVIAICGWAGESREHGGAVWVLDAATGQEKFKKKYKGCAALALNLFEKENVLEVVSDEKYRFDLKTGVELATQKNDSSETGERSPEVIEALQRDGGTSTLRGNCRVNIDGRLYELPAENITLSCIHSRCFSKDGRFYAVSEGSDSMDDSSASHYGSVIRVWDLVAQREINRFSGHRGSILTLAFSPDNTCLASGGEDTTVLMWKLDSSRSPLP